MKAAVSFTAAEVPFTTVVTDLTRCHRTWFHKVYDFFSFNLNSLF